MYVTPILSDAVATNVLVGAGIVKPRLWGRKS
jgi:hypothetical protein